jgi:hypothetical protein
VKPLPAAVRKKRINFRLRKILTPKSPLMVLNEMVGSVTYNFVDNPQVPMNPGMPHLFTAQCNVIKSNEMRVTLKSNLLVFLG